MRAVAAILFAVFAAGSVYADGVTVVQGRVIDSDGAPVSDAEVASLFEDRLGSLTASGSTRTGEDGRYRRRIHLHGGPQAVVVLGADRRQGAVAPIVSGVDLSALDLKLEPLSTVLGDVGCEDLGFGVERSVLTVLSLPERAPVMRRSGGPGGFRFLLPPGRYALETMGGRDHRRAERALQVPAERVELEQGELFAEARAYTRLWGERAPAWTIGAVRGVPGDPSAFTLEGLQGKWVLMLFCDLRRVESLLALLELEAFWKEHARDRDRFAVVAFHAAWAKRFKPIEAALKATPVSLPMVLDPSGATQRAYRVEEPPRLLLVDPDGYLVHGDSSFVAEHLRR